MDFASAVASLQRFLDTPVLWVGDTVILLSNLLAFCAVLAGAWLIARGLKRLAARVFRAESEEEEGASAIAEPIVFWSFMAAGTLVALDALGVRVSTVRDVLNAHLFTVSGASVTLSSILVAALFVALTWGVSRLLRRWTARNLRARDVDEGTVAAAQRLLHYAVMAVGLALALDNMGVSLSALFAAGALFAVGIGFAMQNITQNFVSGLILLAERSIKPGDVLEVETMVVVVEKMGIRSTVARTRDEEEIIIPNSTLVQNSVKNYTLRDSLYRLRATVGVEYGSDMRLVSRTLAEAAEACDWRFKGKEPVVLLREFADSSVVWEVSVWMNDPWTSQRAHSRLNETVWFALQDAGITIAFPQLDVHFDEALGDGQRRLEVAG